MLEITKKDSYLTRIFSVAIELNDEMWGAVLLMCYFFSDNALRISLQTTLKAHFFDREWHPCLVKSGFNFRVVKTVKSRMLWRKICLCLSESAKACKTALIIVPSLTYILSVSEELWYKSSTSLGQKKASLVMWFLERASQAIRKTAFEGSFKTQWST